MKKRKARRVALIEEPENRIPYSAGFGYQVPPDFDSVCIYFSQKGYAEIASDFYQYYDKRGWLTITEAPIRNWKVLATDWFFDYSQSLKLAQRKIENIL